MSLTTLAPGAGPAHRSGTSLERGGGVGRPQVWGGRGGGASTWEEGLGLNEKTAWLITYITFTTEYKNEVSSVFSC